MACSLLPVWKQQYFYFRFTVMPQQQLDFVVKGQNIHGNSETFVGILRPHLLQPEM